MNAVRMGLFLVEESDGRVAVQIFADPDAAEKMFKDLEGNPGDIPSRATLVTLDFNARKVGAISRKLPCVVPADKRPDGWRLGSGPIVFDKEVVEGGENEAAG